MEGESKYLMVLWSSSQEAQEAKKKSPVWIALNQQHLSLFFKKTIRKYTFRLLLCHRFIKSALGEILNPGSFLAILRPIFVTLIIAVGKKRKKPLGVS